jgi:hypothetical protein
VLSLPISSTFALTLAADLAEVDAYVTLGIEQNEFNFDRAKPKHTREP